MIIYVDIDETICNTPKRNYEGCTPIKENINKVNELYDEGNTIVYWTARGTKSNIDWRELTLKQLNKWGCKYHSLETLKKPYFDILIDDRVINSKLSWKTNDDVKNIYKLNS